MRTYTDYALGLVSISFRKNSPHEILDAMKEAGLTYIEWGSDVHATPEKAREISKLTESYGIECCSYGTYFRLGVTPINELESYITSAKILGTDILRLWCGDKNSEEYSDSERAALFDTCKEAARIAQSRGVVLCMECHNNTFTNDKNAALKLMQTISSENFRMYWQPNQFKTVQENIEYLRLLKDYITHIHVFNWEGKQKFPLGDAIQVWRDYLAQLDRKHALLLEFMPDNQISSLGTEAESLRKII